MFLPSWHVLSIAHSLEDSHLMVVFLVFSGKKKCEVKKGLCMLNIITTRQFGGMDSLVLLHASNCSNLKARASSDGQDRTMTKTSLLCPADLSERPFFGGQTNNQAEQAIEQGNFFPGGINQGQAGAKNRPRRHLSCHLLLHRSATT
jgi:hypothetical protein